MICPAALLLGRIIDNPMVEDHVSEILASLPVRISDVVKPWAERSPDQAGLVEASGTWTYAQLASVIAETQGWLRDLDVRPGDRVMIVCENCRAFVAILLALSELNCLARAGERAIVGARSR